MKLKLPQQLLLALLVTFIITPTYAANITLSQADATAKKTYESGTNTALDNTPLGQSNFTLGGDVTFTGYDYQYGLAKQVAPGSPGGVKNLAPSYGNVFRVNRLAASSGIDTLKGDTARSYSLSFVKNMSTYWDVLAIDTDGIAYGGAASFNKMVLSDLDKLSFSGNQLINILGHSAASFWQGFAYGGALYGRDLTFTRMNELSFSDNTVESNVWAGGGGLAIFISGDSTVMSYIDRVSFDGNKVLSSSSIAGAVGGGMTGRNTKVHNFSDIGVMSFTNNMVGYSDVVLDEGVKDVSFSGGALSIPIFTYQRGEKLIFVNNSVDASTQAYGADAYGGAIHATVRIQIDHVVASDTATGGISILFEGNKVIGDRHGAEVSDSFGGAITTGDLRISASGHVLFKNNYASTKGGAISINGSTTSSDTLVLQAQHGDITFVGNTHLLDASNERNSGIANSIYAGPFVRGFSLSATLGRAIYFYDAIESVVRSANVFKINFGAVGYDGSVVFSGEKVEETLAGSEGSFDYAARVAASKISALNAEMNLSTGSLVLKSGVTLGKLADAGTGESGAMFNHKGVGTLDISDSTLTVEKLDSTYNAAQDGGGEFAIWKIGAGAKLVANTIDFSDGMGFDLAHYMTANGFQDQGGLAITAKSTTFGGKLIISDGIDSYTDNIWSKKGVFTLLDTTNTVSTGSFTDITSKLTGSNLVEDPYQHKGSWTYAWIDSKLVATWTPTGWIEDVHPELEGNIVSNSMWSSASNVKSLSETALGNVNILRLQSSLRSSFWVKGMGDFAYDDSTSELDGYSYQGGGYAAGADFKVGKQSLFGVAFGQLMGDNKSELYSSKIKQESMMANLYVAHLQTLNKRNSLLWTLAGTYGTTDNSMKTHYSDNTNSAGTWDNTAYFVETKLEWRINPEGRNWTYKPFIGVEYTDVAMDSFTETGDKIRHFGEGSYKSLSLPIGIGFEHQKHFGKKTWVNSLSLAYVPDVYRDAPSTQATRLSNGFSWKDQGSKASIHTLRATVNSTLQLNAAWTAYAGYTFEAREGASYHNVNTGVSYSF